MSFSSGSHSDQMQQSAVTEPGAPKPLRFEDYENLCHWITRKLVAGQHQSMRRMSYEDVFQEIALLWCKCRDNYDPSLGVKFSTYFSRSALLQWRNLRRGLLGRNAELTDSLHEVIGNDGEGPTERMDLMPDYEATNPELAAMRAEAVRLECDANPLLAKLTELAVKPPPDIHRHLKALQAQHAWAKQLGVTLAERAPEALTPTMVRDMLLLNWRQRKLVGPLRGLIKEMP